MAISFPHIGISDLINVKSAPFTLNFVQEISRSASGGIQAKDLAPAIWGAAVATAAMPIADCEAAEMALLSLDGSIQRLEIYDPLRPYPLAHADGVFSDVGVIASIADGKRLTVSGLANGMVLSVGDRICFDYDGGTKRAFHKIVETVTVSGGVTPGFEVRPHIEASNPVGLSVTLKKPRLRCVLVPNSLQIHSIDRLTGALSFAVAQALS